MQCLHGGRGQQGTAATQWLRTAAHDGGGGRAGCWDCADAPAPVIEAGEATHEQRPGGFVIVSVTIVLSVPYKADDH